MTLQNYLQLKAQTANTKRYLKSRKKDWRQYYEQIHETNNSTNIWKKIKWFTAKTNNKQKLPQEPTEKYNFIKLQSPDWVLNKFPSYDKSSQNLTTHFLTVTKAEIHNAIYRKKNSKTTPGRDEISYSLLYHLPENAINILTKFYNYAISNNYIPEEWKTVQIIPIPKPHKVLSIINNFRPIALLTYIIKILETIITDKLQHHLQKHNLWPRNQN